MTRFKPCCDVLWIGSYPFTDPRKACRTALSEENVLPHWPQLPKRSRLERMVEQTLAAMKTKDGTFPSGTASTWNMIFRELKRRKKEAVFFKSQIMGPLALFVGRQAGADAKGEPGMTDWNRHARSQIRQIRKHGYQPILMLDEPMLPSHVRNGLGDLIAALKQVQEEGALAGVHCCNRISPRILAETGADIIHFDAVHYPSLLNPSKKSLQNFLRGGGVIAWGIVPTTEPVEAQQLARIEKGFLDVIQSMEGLGLTVSKILSQSMIAPVCGTGLLKPAEALKILRATSDISKRIKSRYKLN